MLSSIVGVGVLVFSSCGRPTCLLILLLYHTPELFELTETNNLDDGLLL
jgi:hypothetical protein